MSKKSQKYPTYFLKKALNPIINPKSTEDDRLFHEFMGFFAQLTPGQIASNVRLLASYRVPDNVYPFLVIGTILGYSLGEIYHNYFTPKTRVIMWQLFSSTWNEKVKNVYTPFFIKLKNRIYRMFGGETYKHYSTYIIHLNGAFDKIVKFYGCLLENRIIISTSTNVKSLKKLNSPNAKNKNRPKSPVISDGGTGSEIKEDQPTISISSEINPQPSLPISEDIKIGKSLNIVIDSDPTEPPNLEVTDQYIKIFGNKFDRNNISSIGILINVIRLDYKKSIIMNENENKEAPSDNEEAPDKILPDICKKFVSGIKNDFLMIKTSLGDLGDKYGLAQINAVEGVWDKCTEEMEL